MGDMFRRHLNPEPQLAGRGDARSVSSYVPGVSVAAVKDVLCVTQTINCALVSSSICVLIILVNCVPDNW